MIKVFVSNVFLGNLKENGSAIVARLKTLFILYFFITLSIKSKFSEFFLIKTILLKILFKFFFFPTDKLSTITNLFTFFSINS